MAATVPSGLVYPVGSDTAGNLRDHIKDLADSTQAALTRQANAYTGTNAERLAHTPYASNGTLWSSTDGDEKVYQFRKGQWFPEYLEVELEPAFGGNPVFTFSNNTKLHVYNFGRFVQLQATFTNPLRNYIQPVNVQLDLARIPEKYCPASSLYGVCWGRGRNRSKAMLRYAVNRHTGADDGRRVLIRAEESFDIATNENSGSWVTFSETWSIPNSRWDSQVFG